MLSNDRREPWYVTRRIHRGSIVGCRSVVLPLLPVLPNATQSWYACETTTDRHRGRLGVKRTTATGGC